jgi:ribosomal protein S18 acetylase RimI-like enzyme
MEMLSLVPADHVDLDTLTRAFNRGFTNYYVPLTQTPESLAMMMEANDVSLADSLVALDGVGDPAGVGLLALRPPRGWVAGMGVAPAWRGRGQGEMLLRALIARARERDLRLLQLEVLDQNDPARRLYRRLHFIERRHLLIYSGPLAPRTGPLLAGPGLTAAPIEPMDALAQFAPLHVVEPSWQRELPSLRYAAPRLKALGLWEGQALAAYVLYNDLGNGLPVLDAGARAATAEQRAASVELLLRLLATGRPGLVVRAINVPPGDPLRDAFAALNCPVSEAQWEMTLDLSR